MISYWTHNKFIQKFVHPTVAIFAIAGLGITALPNPSQASQVIQLRSGQVSGVPGTPGQTDTNITYWTKGLSAAPLSPVAFTAADFDKAKGIGCISSDICGSAQVVAPYPFASPPWLPSLTSDPLARWINWQEDPNTTYGSPAASVLYAYPFTVSGPINNASINLYWAVDDFLGEYIPGWPDPNPIGVFINGFALNSSFSGAGRYPEYSASQSGIEGLLTPGQNWLYFYQRDAGAGLSGSIFSAKISVNVPEPSSVWGLAALGILGAGSVLKRKINSSKSTEAETKTFLE